MVNSRQIFVSNKKNLFPNLEIIIVQLGSKNAIQERVTIDDGGNEHTTLHI